MSQVVYNLCQNVAWLDTTFALTIGPSNGWIQPHPKRQRLYMTNVRLCEACGSATKLYKGLDTTLGFRRTRECKACGVRYNTLETRMVVSNPPPLPQAEPEVAYDQDEDIFEGHEEEHCDEYGNPLPQSVLP